jgi:hypothetical protein
LRRSLRAASTTFDEVVMGLDVTAALTPIWPDVGRPVVGRTLPREATDPDTPVDPMAPVIPFTPGMPLTLEIPLTPEVAVIAGALLTPGVPLAKSVVAGMQELRSVGTLDADVEPVAVVPVEGQITPAPLELRVATTAPDSQPGKVWPLVPTELLVVLEGVATTGAAAASTEAAGGVDATGVGVAAAGLVVPGRPATLASAVEPPMADAPMTSPLAKTTIAVLIREGRIVIEPSLFTVTPDGRPAFAARVALGALTIVGVGMLDVGTGVAVVVATVIGMNDGPSPGSGTCAPAGKTRVAVSAAKARPNEPITKGLFMWYLFLGYGSRRLGTRSKQTTSFPESVCRASYVMRVS